MPHAKIISAKNLNFSYPEALTVTLSNVTFEVTVGEFALLCGRTGSGKTTLLRQLIPALAPHGQLSGSLEVKGSVGFVQQDPDSQIVTDSVFHELAFALENQSIPTQTIRRKVAEIASYFGLEHLLESATYTLSGGQKQILNLAAALVAEPDILVLDEPTSELDPIAAQNFLRHLTRVNRELGTTIVCCEHRLDEVLSLCDKVFLIGRRSRQCESRYHESRQCKDYHCAEPDSEGVQTFTPQEFVNSCQGENSDFAIFLPEPTQIALAVGLQGAEGFPLDVREGRLWLQR